MASSKRNRRPSAGLPAPHRELCPERLRHNVQSADLVSLAMSSINPYSSVGGNGGPVIFATT